MNTHNFYFLEFVMEYFNNRLIVGCEIGVWKGEHALKMLQQLSLKKLYLIDWYKIKIAKDAQKFADINLKSYLSRIKWIYQDSTLAAQEILEKLDFVYIDASHRYNAVKRDIQTYYPLLKKGGILGGHDYYEGTEMQTLMGVKPAVDEFVAQNKLFLKIGIEREKYKEWWVIKK